MQIFPINSIPLQTAKIAKREGGGGGFIIMGIFKEVNYFGFWLVNVPGFLVCWWHNYNVYFLRKKIVLQNASSQMNQDYMKTC